MSEVIRPFHCTVAPMVCMTSCSDNFQTYSSIFVNSVWCCEMFIVQGYLKYFVSAYLSIILQENKSTAKIGLLIKSNGVAYYLQSKLHRITTLWIISQLNYASFDQRLK